MPFIAAYERRIFSGDHDTCQAVYNRLTAGPESDDSHLNLRVLTSGQPVEPSARGFAVQMSVALGVYLGKGTPLALVSDRDSVVTHTVLDFSHALPFSSGRLYDLAAGAMQRRLEGGSTLTLQGVTAAEKQAEHYGWLAGASNPAAMAQRIESYHLC